MLKIENDKFIINPAFADSVIANDLFIITTSATYGGGGEYWRGKRFT